MDLNGKIVMMTGACGGIGSALIPLLREKGANVYGFDLCEPEEPHEGVAYIQVDVTNSDQIRDALEHVKEEADILINLAGVMRRGDLFDATEKEWDLLFDVNVKASWLMVKLCRDKLKKDATVLQMSSRHGQTIKPDPALYSLTKHAAYGLAELLERTCPDYTVKIACPGSIDTPLSRHGVPEERMEEKRKAMRPPSFIAEMLVELLESDNHSRILFDEEKWEEYFA